MTARVWVAVLALLLPAAMAAQATVSGSVLVKHAAKDEGNSANVVVALTPVDGHAEVNAPEKHYRLAQKDRTFVPHLLVVPQGATVDFPNLDPLFHNVFSLYNGKRFDLGLYEAGSSRSVRFTRPGVSYIFCNIHSEMSAVVITMATPYYDVTDNGGRFSIANVPIGEYRLSVWYERATQEDLASLARRLTVSGSETPLGIITLSESAKMPTTHKNKYGRDYDNATPYNPAH